MHAEHQTRNENIGYTFLKVHYLTCYNRWDFAPSLSLLLGCEFIHNIILQNKENLDFIYPNANCLTRILMSVQKSLEQYLMPDSKDSYQRTKDTLFKLCNWSKTALDAGVSYQGLKEVVRKGTLKGIEEICAMRGARPQKEIII